MGRKLFISVSLAFSTIIILLGGYNCASQYEQPGPGQPGPHGPPPGPPPDDDDDPELPDEPEDSRCNRSYWRERIRELGAASAFVRLNRSNFEDFNLGQPINFSIDCTRVLLNMSRVSGSSGPYKGKLYLVYEQGNSPVGLQYDSGRTAKENKYNTWYGSWTANSRGRTGAKFSAIFEHTKKEMAIILQINEVEEEDLTDGETILVGYGDIWFKMFRTAFHYPYNRSDVCLHEGDYVRYAQTRPTVPSWKCWFVPIGPYNCFPRGIDTSFDLKRGKIKPYVEKNIDIRTTPTCYSKFGTFGGLDINKAFDVDSDEDHP